VQKPLKAIDHFLINESLTWPVSER